jgi:hypothetical protein
MSLPRPRHHPSATRGGEQVYFSASGSSILSRAGRDDRQRPVRFSPRFVRWNVYELAYQFDAIRFWDKFNGKWIVGDDFIEPTPPTEFKPMQSLKHKSAI